jgi:hypothetical protein
MAASYPSSIRPFTTKTNILSVIDAADPNSLQEEVVAIETTLGINPALSTSVSSTDVFVSSSSQYSTVSLRLANLERGIVGDSHTQYVKKVGNETIVNAVPSNVAITVRGATNQTANLTEWKTSTGTTVASINSAGRVTASRVEAPEVDQSIILAIFGG